MGESIQRYLLLVQSARNQRPADRVWCPPADVYKVPSGWVVRLDIAGISPDEVEISRSGPLLNIKGCRKDSYCTDAISFHQLEISYSCFEKTLKFPCEIESSAISTEYRDGILTVYLEDKSE
jgi:HSP20 family protein